ncbi:MAG: alpha-L-fucosidase [Verrucomicrobiota bacterium]|nr:alpha-L-fucosidase [Verrucomicrobiota bacterium]
MLYYLLHYLLGALVLVQSLSNTANASELKFEASVESLQNYSCPQWFRDAKFGIYLHWGAYSVAEQGEWYARNLYIEGRPEYKHHLATYGHPSEFGYQDFIPMWKAENFDPDALLSLFKEAGAKYFTPCAVHHDNFDLWDSKHHEWNTVNKGPRKDLIGLWKAATHKAGLRFGVTTHLSRSYSWLNTANQADKYGEKAGIPYDGAAGAGVGLYPPNDGQSTHPRAPFEAPKQWREHWAKRVKQLIDDYEPDHLYFDCAVPFRGSDAGKTGMDVISHFYNQRPEGVMCIKERPWQGLYADGITTLDFERGKASSILDDPWQTDDSIGSWGYKAGAPYMTPDLVVDKLIDIVSKNGNMLLNIPIRADGTLDETATALLKDVGKWFAVNGEGIYGTRPWYMYGEGHNKIGHKDLVSSMTAKDFRYTPKGDALYAFVLDWPKGNRNPVVFPNLVAMNQRIGAITQVSLLGHDGELKWENHGDGLHVYFPNKKPCDYAYTLKIGFDDAQ